MEIQMLINIYLLHTNHFVGHRYFEVYFPSADVSQRWLAFFLKVKDGD